MPGHGKTSTWTPWQRTEKDALSYGFLTVGLQMEAFECINDTRQRGSHLLRASGQMKVRNERLMTSTITQIFIPSYRNHLMNAHLSTSSTLSLLNVRSYTSVNPLLRTLSWDRTPTRRGPLSISRRPHFISMLGQSINLPSFPKLCGLYSFCPLKQEDIGLAHLIRVVERPVRLSRH